MVYNNWRTLGESRPQLICDTILKSRSALKLYYTAHTTHLVNISKVALYHIVQIELGRETNSWIWIRAQIIAVTNLTDRSLCQGIPRVKFDEKLKIHPRLFE